MQAQEAQDQCIGLGLWQFQTQKKKYQTECGVLSKTKTIYILYNIYIYILYNIYIYIRYDKYIYNI